MNTSTTRQRQAPVGRRPRGADSAGRERLLDAAIDLFAERGIANTTVARIAEAGRVTSAMVHYWFDTRDKLLDAVVDERWAPMMRQIWAPADAEQQGALDLVRGLLGRLLGITKQAPWLPSLWLREIVQEGGLLRDRALARIPQDRSAAFRRTIARAAARGEINPDISPELVFISMLGLVMLPQASIGGWRRVNPSATLDRAEFERHVMGILLHGLAPPVRSPHAKRSRRRSK